MLAQLVGKGDIHFLVGQLRFELQQELVDDAHDDDLIECLEADDRIEPIAELGREQALDVDHLVANLPLVGKTHGGLVQCLGARIGRHDDDDVAEVGLAPVVVGQRAMVHHLQQHVEDVRMGLFDFIKQEHTVRLLGDSLGQQTALVKADVAGWRTNQAAHRVALHVLAHVKADQLDPHDVGQLLGGLSLANAGGAAEQEGANRLVALAQPGARHLDGRGQHVDGLVLPENDVLQVTIQRLEFAAVIVGDIGWRDAGDLGHNLLDLRLADDLFALGRRQDALRGACLVDDVNRLVGQMPVIDVLGTEFRGGLQCGQRVLDVVVLFKTRLQAFENFHRLLDGWLHHIDLLEAP